MLEDIDIKEIPIKGGYKITILIGGFHSKNPKAYMDNVVSEYVEDSLYNEFIESHLDMPQVRIILSGINEIDYDKYNGQHLAD
jgi:hypothetical protein